MKNWLLLGFFLLSAFQSFGQIQDLPRNLTEEEENILKKGNYTFPQKDHNTNPPDAAMRSMAEWEELQAIVITWTSYRPILSQIVDAAKEECEVLIICNNVNSVQSYLTQQGVDWSQNVRFRLAPYNSVWIRDYGPNSVYQNDVEELAFIDWIYNRPRPMDDLIPQEVSEELGIPIFSTTDSPNDLVHTGGNFMSDGMGTGFSSKLVLDENGQFNNWGISNHSENQIDEIMERYMGIVAYPKMENLLYDAIHHIDMHMKLLDEETLLVGYYADDVADGPQINANIEFVLSQFKTPFGNDYKVHRIEMPPDFSGNYPDFNGDYRTYTNSLIVNSTILVPTYEEKYDSTALRLWEEMMPGYNIVGINCNAIIPANGAIHCITKEVGVHQPILINMPKTVEACIGEETELFALVQSSSTIDEVLLKSRIKGQTEFESLPMSYDTEENRWEISLDPMTENREIEYYVSASNEAGKSINRPLVAPGGYWSFEVKTCSVSSSFEVTEAIQGVNIFPNPANNLTCLKFESDYHLNGRINLMNHLGQKVMEVFNGDFAIGENTFFIDVSSVQKGFYHLVIETRNGKIAKKLLVQ